MCHNSQATDEGGGEGGGTENQNEVYFAVTEFHLYISMLKNLFYTH
jgi:hypothetical protein